MTHSELPSPVASSELTLRNGLPRFRDKVQMLLIIAQYTPMIIRNTYPSNPFAKPATSEEIDRRVNPMFLRITRKMFERNVGTPEYQRYLADTYADSAISQGLEAVAAQQETADDQMCRAEAFLEVFDPPSDII